MREKRRMIREIKGGTQSLSKGGVGELRKEEDKRRGETESVRKKA